MFGSTVKRVRKALPAIYAGASVHLDGLNIVFTLEAKNPMGYDSAMFRHVWVDPIVRRTKWLGFTNLRTGKLYQDWFLVNLVYKVETPTVSGLTNQVFHYRFIDPNIKEPGDWWW
ncbi:hypothetical protein GCM10011379_07060 [Filimonas zeae]|uniref:Uncharacterized protein n=2 Tax=Filimonas zeae TaxID=1737353 RepID=A0A917IQ09_9BACT|nr:hypothetical protein GCM10011379_07060 [Filimonas zeae]